MNAAVKSPKLPIVFKKIVSDLGCLYQTAGGFVVPGDDGVHLSASSHKKLAKAVEQVIKN